MEYSARECRRRTDVPESCKGEFEGSNLWIRLARVVPEIVVVRILVFMLSLHRCQPVVALTPGSCRELQMPRVDPTSHAAVASRDGD
jgi:hypothetical protein